MVDSVSADESQLRRAETAVKTLVCITVTDRLEYLEGTVRALVDTGWNGPTILADDSKEKVPTPDGVTLHQWRRGWGCSKQLNAVLKQFREPGDWFVWMPDDVKVTTDRWILMAQAFGEAHPDVGLITGMLTNFTFHGGTRHEDEWGVWWETPFINTPTIFTPAYLDQVRFVDDLGPGHMWGYQDVLASHRCRAMGLKIAQLESIFGHHAQHPEGNHPQLAADWYSAFKRRMDLISAGCTRLMEDGFPI